MEAVPLNCKLKTNFSYDPPKIIPLTSTSETSEPPKGFVPLANLGQTMTSTLPKTFGLCTSTVNMPNISELPEKFEPLTDLDQTMASTSSKTFSLCTSTVKEKYGYQLANKLRKQHIFFFKQNLKV
ncbi:uncharacterized protein LOC112694428 isoform X2 [Sipha flava]|uniref:Uncharacterized protein LOC112694428 isoform X2 n=1 Tax=Sipha flava TaxID=143950 RepID=A0A8B8GQY7_9HEMI|nr:uncharacterized protein LOC112694428 isoform X2 [Sipha flava]